MLTLVKILPKFIAITIALGTSAIAARAADEVTATDFAQTTIYHSPQSPGYTAWCTLWRAKDGTLRLAFQQVTGPVDNWEKRKNVTVILSSADEAATWKPFREVPARHATAAPHDGIYAAPGSSSFSGHGVAALDDGTLVTGLWPGDDQKSGYLQRSTDDGLTWSAPIHFLNPDEYKTYPTQIHRLRDGRLVLVAGVVKQADAKTALWLLKQFFQSTDGGKTWSHIWTMPAETGLCEESDFVELDSGDLLFVHRAEHYDGNKYINSDRLINVFHRDAQNWKIGPVAKAPFPHSGFPELLKTREGVILHIATDGVWQTSDEGKLWSKIEGIPASPYYPRATQLKDGRILVVGHVGGDDKYGSVNQTIVQQTYKINMPVENHPAQPDQNGKSDKSPAPTLTDLWSGKAKWVPDADKIGTAFGFHFFSIIPEDREFWAYYIHNYTAGDGNFKMTVGRARGNDGINWADDGMVLDVGRDGPSSDGKPSWDDRLTSFPGAWKDGDTWFLVYEGASENPALSPGDIGLATSTDGKTFVKHPSNPILRHNPIGWECANIGTPSLYKENGLWYLFYHGYDSHVCQIGVASGKSLTELTKSPANPILPVGGVADAWDTGTTGHRSAIVKEGDYYYFAFEGSTLPPFDRAKWSSGLARAANLTGPWEKLPTNPMIPQTSSGMNNDGPELLQIGATWYLYVRQTDPSRGNATARFRLEARR